MVLTNIQVLRGIAAMLVVWVHSQLMIAPALVSPVLRQAGFGGVDLFFVISGFIIVHSTADSSDWATFARRRLLRIAPLYYVFTFIATVICYVRPSVFNLSGISAVMIPKSLAFIPFEVAPNSVYPVYPLGWTLNYEMFFYALFTPMLLLGGVRARIAMLGGILSLLVVAGLWISHPADHGIIPYFYTRTVMLDFIFGMVIAGLRYRFPTGSAVPYYVLVTAGFLGLVFSGLILPSQTVTVFPWSGTALRYGVPAALIVAGMVGLDTCGHSIGNRLLKLLGDASYSIYLSHFFVVMLVEFAFAQVAHNAVVTLLAGATAMIAAPAFGVLIYRTVERPLAGDFRYLPRASASPRRAG